MADLAWTESVALVGTDARLVRVEVHTGGGLPSFAIVGLPTPSIREAAQRTRAAIVSKGSSWPQQRVTANLAPAGLRKEGTHFDLPIALGVLAASDQMPVECLQGWVMVGELALNGEVRPVRGALAAAMEARRSGRKGVVCAGANAPEAALIEGIQVVSVRSLKHCVAVLTGDAEPDPVEAAPMTNAAAVEDLRDVRGQATAKRALEIAAAGAHNLLIM